MGKANDENDLGPEQRDGRPVEDRAAEDRDGAGDDDVPEDETIENVGY